eukprot:CAMPEP_0179316108 /NCGR_PEP_ID=MMETSP0797-20121207/55482_1 /TAXON_ID=47934 /ORGANISM="Dinophysis acuminata, Strain DAEP01" /LENGTH=43 /DNA_ID= /DNA_START= /DNA_END= /DNA_ORIENTATION=
MATAKAKQPKKMHKEGGRGSRQELPGSGAIMLPHYPCNTIPPL